MFFSTDQTLLHVCLLRKHHWCITLGCYSIGFSQNIRLLPVLLRFHLPLIMAPTFPLCHWVHSKYETRMRHIALFTRRLPTSTCKFMPVPCSRPQKTGPIIIVTLSLWELGKRSPSLASLRSQLVPFMCEAPAQSPSSWPSTAWALTAPCQPLAWSWYQVWASGGTPIGTYLKITL